MLYECCLGRNSHMKGEVSTRDRDRVAALIIRDGKLLLVTGYGAGYFWTPGGKIDEGEDHEQALRREIREELGVEILGVQFFTEMEYENPVSGKQQTSYYYLASMEGEPVPAQEISDCKFFDATQIPGVTHFVNDDSLMSKLLEEGKVW